MAAPERPREDGLTEDPRATAVPCDRCYAGIGTWCTSGWRACADRLVRALREVA